MRSIERWKFRWRYYCRQSALSARGAACGACSSSAASCDACSSGVTSPAAFTTLLNIDKRTNKRSSLSFDSDSTTVVCDNSVNVHVCNSKQFFVGKLQPVCLIQSNFARVFTGMATSTLFLYNIPPQTYQRCKSIKDSASHECTQRWFPQL